jgi:hypothetical protein
MIKSRWNSAIAASMRYISLPSLVVVSMPCSRNRNAMPWAASSSSRVDQVAGGAPDPVQAGRDQNVAGVQGFAQCVPGWA